MKKTYTITGMTCNSCKSSVHQKLNELKEVEDVEVNLEKSEAVIFLTENIDISKLQNSLPSKFQITEKLVDDTPASFNNSIFSAEFFCSRTAFLDSTTLFLL